MRNISYKLKTINSDFLVREISLIPFSSLQNESKYTYIWVEKSGYTTFQAEKEMSIFFGLGLEHINHQGLKDEDAVTQQAISIKKIITKQLIAEFNKIHSKGDDFINIHSILGNGDKPFTAGNLHGNCFKIKIRNISSNLAEKIQKYCGTNRFISFVNYYDKQRFGMAGGPYNTHKIGQALIEKNAKTAVKELSKTKNAEEIKDFEQMKVNGISFRELITSVGLNKATFFVNSYDSMLE